MLNLDPSTFGSLAEIGAGQEVARWFLTVGGASGTVAKTISAYDKQVSDDLYGSGSRCVSRQRLEAMLENEWAQLLTQLEATRRSQTRFFSFADTVSARNHAGTNDSHGWLGLRFQLAPGGPTNDMLLHINMRDASNVLQQEAIGILGVNLIHAAFYHFGTKEANWDTRSAMPLAPAFDNPDLIVACIIGDGEAETASLATAWQSNKFLDPITDGAVLPILHLNGYKISNPTVLARIEHEELEQFLRGCGWTPYFVEGDEPEKMHELMATSLDKAIDDIRQFQSNARTKNDTARPRWPMIVLKSPKGWTGPRIGFGVDPAELALTRCPFCGRKP